MSTTSRNLRAWLTTVVARVCLDMLRTRTSRREDPLGENATHVPDPVITRVDRDPESDAMLADSVGLALLVVLETLEPAERLAYVLHDVFGMTFDETAPIVDRSAEAARQLASRARRHRPRRSRGAVCPMSSSSSTAILGLCRAAPMAECLPCSLHDCPR